MLLCIFEFIKIKENIHVHKVQLFFTLKYCAVHNQASQQNVANLKFCNSAKCRYALN